MIEIPHPIPVGGTRRREVELERERVADFWSFVRWCLATTFLAIVAMLLVTLAGCTAAQIQTAEDDARALARRAQTVLAAYRANEQTVDQLVAVGARVAGLEIQPELSAQVAAGVAEVRAHPEAVAVLEAALAQVAAPSSSR